MSKKLNMILKAQIEQNTNSIYDLKSVNATLYESHKDILDKFNTISIRMLQTKEKSSDLSSGIADALRSYSSSSENLGEVTMNLNNFSDTISTSKLSFDTIVSDCNGLISNEHSSVALIKQTASLTDKLSNSIVDLESAVTTLSQGAQDYIEFINSITALTKSVANIAEHTGLLSLNAAIEAARAGDSGKGFAVVAEQVKILASLTVNLTVEIDSITDKMGVVSEQVGDSVNDCILQLVDSVDKMNQVLEKISVYLTVSKRISVSSKKSMLSLTSKLKPSIDNVIEIGGRVEERINQFKIFVLTDASDSATALISRVDNPVDLTSAEEFNPIEGQDNGIMEDNITF